MDVAQLTSAVTENTSYNTVPAVKTELGTVGIEPGNSYVITTQTCPAGERIAFELRATETLALNYFQNSGAPAIGLYITVC